VGDELGQLLKEWDTPEKWWERVRQIAAAVATESCSTCGGSQRFGVAEVTVAPPSGRARHFRVTWCGHQHEADGGVRDAIVVADCTDRRRLEQELRNSTHRMDFLIGDLPLAVLFADREQTVEVVNDEFCRVFRMPVEPEVLIGQNCGKLMDAARSAFADPDGFIDTVSERITSGVPVRGEEIALADGRVLERDYLPILDGEHLRGHLWQYRDVTERHRATEEVARQEGRWRTLFAAAPGPVIVFSGEGRILDWNAASETALGWTAEQACELSVADILLTGEGHDRVSREDVRRCDGSVVRAEVTIASVPDEEPAVRILFLRLPPA
jgi:PAS domain S-box-containing protein